MADISKINVNGTEYDIRSSFPTIQMLNSMSSPATDFSGSIKPYNIYGKIYKINFEIEVPLNSTKKFTLKNPEKGTKYEIVSGEGIITTDYHIISRMTNQRGSEELPSLMGLTYSRESDSLSPLKLEFTNNTGATTQYESTVKYYIEFTLHEQTSN